MTQPRPAATGERLPSPPSPAPFDAVRLEQFLALERGLLTAAGEPEALAERFAQGVALFLGAPGAAVGLADESVYRLVAGYGVGPEYAARFDRTPLAGSALGDVLAAGRPRSLQDPPGSRTRTVLFPFSGPEVSGALHLVLAADAALPDRDLQLVRALTPLLAATLANARQHQRLGQLARLKSDALTAMAHDLRAPLNALIGYASLLGEGAFGPLGAEQREVAATLERQALELVDLLGAALDVARIESGRLPVRAERFSLAELLAGLRAGTFAQPARDGRLEVRLPADLPPLCSDRVKVKEIVQNLVDNALKHGRGRVEVEAALVPERETVRLTVRDAGPGVGADVLPHLFEAFRPGSPGGTGFGLYLVRCFAEALGGRVAARSLPGEGTAITVELPLAAPVR